MMRYASGFLGTAVLAVLATTAVAADFKVAVVDMQRALNECDAGKKAKDQVKGKFDKAQDQLKKQRDEIDKAREEFDKKSLVLKDDQRRDLERDFEAKQLELKRRYEDFQRDLERTDAELTSGIVEQLYGIVGTRRETLALILGALRNEEIIDTRYRLIKILDRQRLLVLPAQQTPDRAPKARLLLISAKRFGEVLNSNGWRGGHHNMCIVGAGR